MPASSSGQSSSRLIFFAARCVIVRPKEAHYAALVVRSGCRSGRDLASRCLGVSAPCLVGELTKFLSEARNGARRCSTRLCGGGRVARVLRALISVLLHGDLHIDVLFATFSKSICEVTCPYLGMRCFEFFSWAQHLDTTLSDENEKVCTLVIQSELSGTQSIPSCSIDILRMIQRR